MIYLRTEIMPSFLFWIVLKHAIIIFPSFIQKFKSMIIYFLTTRKNKDRASSTWVLEFRVSLNYMMNIMINCFFLGKL